MDQTISFGVKYRNVTHDLLHFNATKKSKSIKKCVLVLHQGQLEFPLESNIQTTERYSSYDNKILAAFKSIWESNFIIT